MNKTLAAAMAGFIALGASAHAQNSMIASPASSIPNFDVQSVGPILNELGVIWEAKVAQNGQAYIAAGVQYDQGALQFILAPAACRGGNGDDCVGINMVAIFEGDPNPQTVSAFNYRYAFASAGIDPQNGSAYLSRYEIADYGMPRGNLATSIMVFVNQAVKFSDELATARRTVALDGYADDLSASMLNRQVRTEVAGVENHINNPVDAHDLGLEEGALYVREFLRDKAAPRNKIENLKK